MIPSWNNSVPSDDILLGIIVDHQVIPSGIIVHHQVIPSGNNSPSSGDTLGE
jgi:hypothetical protein